MLTRPKLDPSDLHEHKFRHGFKDTLNLPCPCCIEAETTTSHYFLRYDFYNVNQTTLMNELENILVSLFMVSDSNRINLV